MRWKIEFYDLKVMHGIHEWPASIAAKFAWIVELIKEFGPDEVGMPHVKAMGAGLFEIRAKSTEGIGRALFCIMKGKVVIILSGFIKKTQKTPPRELLLAKKRMLEVKNNE